MEETLRKIMSKSENFHAEAVIASALTKSLVFEKNELLYPKTFEGQKLVVRVTLPDGRAGVSSTLILKNWNGCLRKAKKFAKVSVPDPAFKEIPGKSSIKRKVKLYDKTVESYDSDELWNDAKSIISFAKEKKVKVQKVISEKESSQVFMMNSEGVYNSVIDHAVSQGVSVVKNGVSGGEHLVFTRKPDSGMVVKEAVDRCLLSQKPVSIKSSVMPLVLEYDAFSVLSGVLLNAVDGYSAFKNKSFFSGRQGEKACSSKLSITDNPLLDYGLGSCVHDGEGAPCKKKNLIVRGVVKSFLQDTYTTSVRGEGCNGNCSSITSRPAISQSNLEVSRGSASYNKLLSHADKALLVKEIGGAHMVNTISGDFSNEASKAFIVRKGELTPVKKVMISGNYFKLLKSLELVGNDSKQKNELITPTLFFSEVQAVA